MTKRQFDLMLGTIFLFNVGFIGVRMACKRRVLQGQTSGISGLVAQVGAVGF